MNIECTHQLPSVTPRPPCSHLPSIPAHCSCSKQTTCPEKYFRFATPDLSLSPLSLLLHHINISQICDSAQRTAVCLFQSPSRARSYPDQSPPSLQQSAIHELYPQPILLFRTSLFAQAQRSKRHIPQKTLTVNNPPSNHQNVCYQRGEAH